MFFHGYITPLCPHPHVGFCQATPEQLDDRVPCPFCGRKFGEEQVWLVAELMALVVYIYIDLDLSSFICFQNVHLLILIDLFIDI